MILDHLPLALLITTWSAAVAGWHSPAQLRHWARKLKARAAGLEVRRRIEAEARVAYKETYRKEMNDGTTADALGVQRDARGPIGEGVR